MTTTGHTPLSDAIADQLLELLSSDDDYRSLFAENPRQALADLGYVVPEGEEIACLKIQTLASKEEFRQSRALLKQHLTSVTGLTVVFCYEASKINDAAFDQGDAAP